MRFLQALTLLGSLNLISCTSYKGVLPSYVRNNAMKIHVKNAERGIFSHQIKVDAFGQARVYNSFTKNQTTRKKIFPRDFGFDKMLQTVEDSFNKKSARLNSKFRLDLEFNRLNCESFCADKKAPNPAHIRKLHSEIGIYQEYRFETILFGSWSNSSDAWHLLFAGFVDTRYKNKYFSDLHRPDGLLYSNNQKINVIRADLRDVKRSRSWKTIPILEMTGYKFILDGRILGFINVADQDIWIKNDVDEHLKMILVSAAICILIRNQIS